MKYSEISHGLLVVLCVLAIFYVAYAIWYDQEADMIESDLKYKAFAKEIRLRMETIPELDATEKQKISTEISRAMDKRLSRRTPPLIKSCVVNAARGCITGAVSGGGIEGALVGGAVFGVISPVMVGIEHFMGQ